MENANETDAALPFESAIMADCVVQKLLRRTFGTLTSIEASRKLNQYSSYCDATSIKELLTLILITHDTQPFEQDWSASEEPVN